MVLLGAATLPHGAMPFDGDAYSESAACRERHAKLSTTMRERLERLYSGICKAGELVAAMEAEVIVLCTPHGINLSDAYGVYLNESASGDAMWLDTWSEFKASANLDVNLSKDLLSHLRSEGVSAQGITSFSGLSAQMRWGEVIPLWYIQKYLKNKPRYAIISVDRGLISSAPEMDDQRLAVGAKIGDFLRNLKEKVFLAISVDLAHSHHTDCTNPLYTPDPKMPFIEYPVEAEQYDKSCVQWVTSGKKTGSERGEVYEWNCDEATPHLTSAMAIDPNITRSCGAKGLILLHGLLAHEVKQGASFQAQLTAYEVPTYYGMMAAFFKKN